MVSSFLAYVRATLILADRSARSAAKAWNRLTVCADDDKMVISFRLAYNLDGFPQPEYSLRLMVVV